MTSAVEAALTGIRAAVGPKGIVDDAQEIERYLTETRGMYRGRTGLVVRPASTAEVAEVVTLAAAAGLPIVPQGGNTGLCGGGVPQDDRSIVLSLGRMNRIRNIDPGDFTITVEAGCILAEIQKAAEAADRLFPLSLGAEGSCQIGGNLSTNAGGIGVLHYGNTRDLCLGLEVVLPDGRVWEGLGALRKDNTGYDLKQLFIGAEGTLGIITAATLKLFPRPREIETALLGLAKAADAMELFARARAASGDQLTAFELIPRRGLEFAARHVAGVVDPLDRPHVWYALLDVSSSRPDSNLRASLEAFLGEVVEAGLIADGVVATSAQQSQQLWRIREAMVEAQKFEGGSIKHDVSVAVSRVADCIARLTAAVEARIPDCRPLAFGHVGDGNIHFNISEPIRADRKADPAATKAFLARRPEINAIVHGIVSEMGGSISAEHGIGILKRDELPRYKPAVALDLMRAVKRALDPQDVMNPGKILTMDEPSTETEARRRTR
ncbi:MAG TPA: FAD-binding oxidoreductase [Stellaceae bacterium]|nr:FAD-binding oxidoreductase [Stellaceae bacterium]